MVTPLFLGYTIFHFLDFKLALILHNFEVVPTYLLHAAESFLTT